MGKIFQHAASISGLTLVSRILGVVRDAVIAFVFGASLNSDLFFIAFRPFDLLRKLFSEGILSLSLVPVFSAYLARGEKDQVVAMFWSALFWLSVISTVLISLGLYLLPFMVTLLAPGFAGGGYAHTLTILLVKIMLPYIFILLVLALCMGVLNTLGHFGAPAATPILLNAGILTGVVCFSPEPRVLALAMGVTLGGILQLGFQLPFLIRSGLMPPLWSMKIHPGILKAGKRFFPYMLGAASFQVNLLISAVLASTLGSGSISFLYYAERLVQFPLALLSTSVATVFLPVLSQKAGIGKLGEVRAEFEKGARVVIFLTIPAMAGIMALDHHIVALLFGRGAFDLQAGGQTALCLFFLASGLWAMAGTRLYVTVHYAAADVRLPLLASGASILCHLVMGLLLKESLGAAGLALSLASGSAAGFIVLAARSGFGPSFSMLRLSACRSLFLSVIMFAAVQWAGDLLIPARLNVLSQAGMMVLVIGMGAAGFFLGAIWVAGDELEILKRAISRCPELKK